MARLRDLYKSRIVPELTKMFSYGNIMAVPKVEKVVVSMGIGKASVDKKYLELAKKDLAMITGQMPAVCKAKKSVSNFKVREGMETGLKVTMRGVRMYEFMDRLISLAAFATSEVWTRTGSTDAGTTPWVWRNRVCSRRSILRRWKPSRG